MIDVALNMFDDIDKLIQFCGAVFSKEELNELRPPYSQYHQILQLKGQAEPNHADIARQVAKFIMKHPKLKDINKDEAKSIMIGKMLFNFSYNHACSVTLNAFSEKILCSKGGANVRFYIFDVFSRLNHSCQPNLEQYLNDDDVTVCTAVRQITAREQLFINYLGDMQFKSTLERKKFLKDGWNFDCQCPKCE